MRSVKNFLAVFIVVSVWLAPTGCAFFTAQRVATMAGKEVGKHVIKKGVKKMKEDKTKKDQAKSKQTTSKPAGR